MLCITTGGPIETEKLRLKPQSCSHRSGTGPFYSRPGYSIAMPSWDSIVDVFDIQALSHTVLDRPRTWALQQRWREVFAAETRAETGKWVVGGFEWHSHRCAEDGARALALYQRQQNRPVWVLPVTEYGNSALGFRCDRRPELANSGFDALVVPEDFAWTIAFTHEDGAGVYGPYFRFAPPALEP